MEGNYVTLSETSDEMYAAIEDTVYTHPGGAAGGAEGGGDMYSKVKNWPSLLILPEPLQVDKAKKRGKSLGPEERPAYATVSKGGGVEQGEVLGARPKQRSPCPPHPPSEGVDYSEYEVAHSDSRAHMNRCWGSYLEWLSQADVLKLCISAMSLQGQILAKPSNRPNLASQQTIFGFS